MQGFYQHGGVSISAFIGWVNRVCRFDAAETWALYPCDSNQAVDGLALDSGSGDDIQPRDYVLRSALSGEAFCLVLPLSAADTIAIARYVEVFTTSEVSRARVRTLNHTYTARVRFPGKVCSHPDLLINRLGYKICGTSSKPR